VAQRDPENPNVLYTLGTMQASARELDDARESYLKAIQLDPFNIDAHNALAFVELAASNFSAAENAANMALAEDPKNAQAMVYLGSAKLEQGDTTKAISYFQEALKEAPEHQSARILLGRAFLVAGNHAFAEQCFKTILEQNPRVPQAWEFLGQAQAGAGQHVDASTSFRNALSLGVRKPSLLRALAEAERAAGNEDLAEEILQQAEDPKPDKAIAELARASAAIARGKPREALDLLQNYDGLQVDMLRASALEQMREFDAAIELVERHLDSDEVTDEVRLSYARVLAKVGREAEADTIVDEMMGREDPPLAARIFRGFQLCRAGDTDGIEMLQAVEQVEGLDEVELRRVRRILAATFDRLGQFDEAGQYFEKISGRVSGAFIVAGSVARENEDFLESEQRPAFAGRGATHELPEDPLFLLAWPGMGHEWLMAGIGGLPAVMLVADKPETQLRRRTIIGKVAGAETLQMFTPGDATEVAAAYWQDLARGGLEPRGRQTLDAMWTSAHMLPSIAAIFPRSKVIVVNRDPAEMVLDWLRAGYAELPEMAEYYREQQQLLAEYRQWVPLEFLEADGDALLSDPEPELQRLAEMLGLDWDEAAAERVNNMRVATRPFRGTASDYEDVLEAPLGILGAGTRD
ncbi:MAG: tetratricopeptide repeat protein, partial [Gammaproteobacteria bacterium]|nr:tetratricopeptide repeat protein [Gammaproteobacteria bacterium]